MIPNKHVFAIAIAIAMLCGGCTSGDGHSASPAAANDSSITSPSASESPTSNTDPASVRADTSETPTKDILELIRREVARPTSGSALGRPLPLLSTWSPGLGGTSSCSPWISEDPLASGVMAYVAALNGGCADLGFSPDFQFGLIKSGRHILPTFPLKFDPWTIRQGITTVPGYYDTLRVAAASKLPVVLASTQLESFFYDTPSYIPISETIKLWVFKSSTAYIFPFDDAETLRTWRKGGEEWAKNSQLKLFQSLYPAPSSVILLSNNEYPRVAWQDVIGHCATEPRVCAFLDRNGIERTVDAANPWSANNNKLRKALAEAWDRHYKALFAGFTSGLTPAWSAAAKFVGYEDFLTIDYGYDPRSPSFVYAPGMTAPVRESKGYAQNSWLEGGQRSITMNAGKGNAVPWARTWFGNSASLYFYENTNNLVYSSIVKAQGTVFALDDILANVRADYWFEISIWNSADFYNRLEVPTTDKINGFEGHTQMLLWMFRPRAARTFNMDTTPRVLAQPYFEGALRAVDRVWENPTLTRFWRDSRLLALDDVPHPFSSDLINGFEQSKRWYLLRNSLDSYLDGPNDNLCHFNRQTGKWKLELNPINFVYAGCPNDHMVYAIARERGVAPEREWLIYAYTPNSANSDLAKPSPVAELRNVSVSVPGFRSVTLESVPRAGAFYLVTEHDLPKRIQ